MTARFGPQRHLYRAATSSAICCRLALERRSAALGKRRPLPRAGPCMACQRGTTCTAPTSCSTAPWSGRSQRRDSHVAHALRRSADDEDTPEGWPKAPWSFWYRRHDEFDELPPSTQQTVIVPSELRCAARATEATAGCRAPRRLSVARLLRALEVSRRLPA